MFTFTDTHEYITSQISLTFLCRIKLDKIFSDSGSSMETTSLRIFAHDEIKPTETMIRLIKSQWDVQIRPLVAT